MRVVRVGSTGVKPHRNVVYDALFGQVKDLHAFHRNRRKTQGMENVGI